MNSKSTLDIVNIKNLILDINNPRFAELYSGSEKEEELIEYLLYNEAAKDVAKGIVSVNEFYQDRPLWVIKEGEFYKVKDGNRRCAAAKALNNPKAFGLNLPILQISELPILIYHNIEDLQARIYQEHTNNLFREWDRIAKAIEIYKLFAEGNSLLSLKGIEPDSIQFIKLASFYYEAVKIGGEDLKKLLRRGRGKTGGKTVIFERLFKHQEKCGYKFLPKPSYKIEVLDKEKFKSYIKAIIEFLKENPDTTWYEVDNEENDILAQLIPFGFNHERSQVKKRTPTLFSDNTNSNVNTTHEISPQVENLDDNTIPTSGESITKLSEDLENFVNISDVKPIKQLPKEIQEINASVQTDENNIISESFSDITSAQALTNIPNIDLTKLASNNPQVLGQNEAASGETRGSVKTRPIYTRKKIPAQISNLLKECYSLDKETYPNSKTALTRVTFECTLKYVVENTFYTQNKKIADSQYFKDVFYDGRGNKRNFTDFTRLKNLFAGLIQNTGHRKIFEVFDLELPHQIIHNYMAGATPTESESLCIKLIPLIEFLLREETDLLNSIDLTKL